MIATTLIDNNLTKRTNQWRTKDSVSNIQVADCSMSSLIWVSTVMSDLSLLILMFNCLRQFKIDANYSEKVFDIRLNKYHQAVFVILL